MNRELPSHQNLALMVVLALVLSFIALNLVVVWPSIQMAITGKHFIVYRDDWGTGDWRLLYNAEKQRIRITPEKPLQEWRDFFICPTFPEDWYPYSMSDFPPLSKNREIWIFEYEGDRSPPWMYFTVYTNPRLDNPRRRITNVYETQEKGQKLQLISDSYVYLGYAVRDIEDVQALQDFRSTDPEFDPSQVLNTSERLLWPLKKHVEYRLAANPNDESELATLRSQIPVIIERANAAEGHPMDTVHVLYLDGSIVEIPFGERFPATQEFLDVLFGPDEETEQ